MTNFLRTLLDLCVGVVIGNALPRVRIAFGERGRLMRQARDLHAQGKTELAHSAYLLAIGYDVKTVYKKMSPKLKAEFDAWREERDERS